MPIKYLLAGVAMLTAAGLALAMTPNQKIADSAPKVDLETMIPKQFGDWTLDNALASRMVNPDVQATLDRIYNQMLSRTYVNAQGERVMLSIAYGGNQGKAMQVHRPEVCYTSQGFQIGSISKAFIEASGAKLPVMKLVASQGSRVEPITYWVMIGNSAVRGNLEQGFARLKYGLTGKIPYGILIRVSTISENESQSYRIQEQFVREMISGMPVQYRHFLTGIV